LQDVVKSPFNKKGTLDASGRAGQGYGVYRFKDKYKGNIDTYAPIYNPEAFGDDIITGMSDEAFVKVQCGVLYAREGCPDPLHCDHWQMALERPAHAAA